MRIKLSVEGKPYEFEDNDADNKELMQIERVTSMTIPEWADAMSRGSMLAITALIWIMRRRTEPNLEFTDVEFRPSSLKIENIEEDAPGKEETS
jgi:hypothetical protein